LLIICKFKFSWILDVYFSGTNIPLLKGIFNLKMITQNSLLFKS